MEPQNLQPMDSAPKDGRKILLYVNLPWERDQDKFFFIAKFVEKYSVHSNEGAWRYECPGSVHHAVNSWCEGWMPFPKIPN